MSVLNGLYTEFEMIRMTVKEFFQKASELNLNPVGQRKDTQSGNIGGTKPSKAQGIIDAMMHGADICEAQFARGKSCIDFGHRGRTILAFIRGEFPMHKSSILGEVWWTNGHPDAANGPFLTQEQKDYFWNYNLRFTDFFELDSDGEGKQFIQTNTTTPPNFEEKCNSYGMKFTIAVLREWQEIVDYTKDSVVALAKRGVVDNVLEWFKICAEQKRKKFLGWLLESAVMQKNGKFSSVTEEEIINYIEHSSQKEVKRIEKELEVEYSFYGNLGIFWKKYKNTEPSVGVFHFFRMVYWNLREHGKVFEITDYDQFTKELIHEYNSFRKENKVKPFLQDDGETPADSRYGLITSAFDSYLKKVRDESKYAQAYLWVKPFINMNLVKFKAEGDTFPRDMKFDRWIEVGEIDEVDGLPIAFEDVVGCHIISKDDGGKIEYENLMVSKFMHNKRMGTQNAITYARNYQTEHDITPFGRTAN